MNFLLMPPEPNEFHHNNCGITSLEFVGQEQVDYMLGKFQSAEAIATQLADGFGYYTVSHKGKIEGYMAIFPDMNTSTALLSKIYVRRSARGKGCGRAMLEFAEAIYTTVRTISFRLSPLARKQILNFHQVAIDAALPRQQFLVSADFGNFAVAQND